MARLISPPIGLPVDGLNILSGPRTVGQAETQTIGNFLQTVASPFGVWRFQYTLASVRGEMLRRYRGWITALHGGANATRWGFCDWDGLPIAQRGFDATPAEVRAGQPWSNGQSWSNGKNWSAYAPLVGVGAPAALGASVISLEGDFWGATLDVGDFVGFMPFHFGLYAVTEVISSGTFRIWPPLRKALTTSDYATLKPVLAMRLESEDAAPYARGAAFADNLQFTLVEILDYDVRDYFTE
jgi:hypothetical protein